MKKRIALAFASLLAAALLLSQLITPTLSYQTDRKTVAAGARAGTVVVSTPDLTWLSTDTSSEATVVAGDHLTIWNPGDINAAHWEIDNLGNKSIDLRYTIRLYWNEGPGMTQFQNESAGSLLWDEAPFIYLYPATMADEDIRVDMVSTTPSQFIAIGTSDVQYTNASSAVRYGYSYTFKGATLDGVGDNAETGDATVPGATSDVEGFKVAFAPDAPAGFMNRTLVLALYVEGKQHRNTTDSDWHLVETQEIQ